MNSTNAGQNNEILEVQTKTLTIILWTILFGTSIFSLNSAYIYWQTSLPQTLLIAILSFALGSASLLSLHLVKKGHYFLARRVIMLAAFCRTIHWLIVMPDQLFPIAVTFLMMFIIIGIFLSESKEGLYWVGLGFILYFFSVLIRNLYHTQHTIPVDPRTYFYAIYFFPFICMILITMICLPVVRQFQKALVESAKARKNLEETNKTLENFAYVASHDLQEPLRSITTFAQLLELDNRGNLDKDSQNNIHFIIDGAKRMRQLINDLLQYSRLKTQKIALQPTALNETVKQVLNNLKSSAEESGANIQVSDLPVLHARPSHMTQLFQNLISNAIKFRSGPSTQIQVTASPQENHWLFSIRDNGIGLDPENRDKIFDIFHRLNPADKYPGTGMGLAICQEIVTAHGGHIWVESHLGKGSTFFFTLPKS